MRILRINGALAASIAASAVVRAAAFVCPPTAQIGAVASPSLQHQSWTRPTACSTVVRNGQVRDGEHQRSAWPRRGYCLGRNKAARRTELSASGEASSSGGGGEGIPGVPTLPGMKTVVETEEEEEQRAAREWQDDGRKGRVLVRRKEIPAPDKDPAVVCQLVFQSLQNNDDPMLDYGAAVAVKFASSKSAIKDMTPKEYGDFLRADPEYGLLIDNATCRPAERAKVSADGTQVLQKVEVVGVYPDDAKRLVEVQLTKEDDECWRIDALYFVPKE